MKNLMTFATVGAVAAASVLALAHLRSNDIETVGKIQRGELTLTCNIGGRDKVIDGAKVVDIQEYGGNRTFIFTNGSATNCYLEVTK